MKLIMLQSVGIFIFKKCWMNANVCKNCSGDSMKSMSRLIEFFYFEN